MRHRGGWYRWLTWAGRVAGVRVAGVLALGGVASYAIQAQPVDADPSGMPRDREALGRGAAAYFVGLYAEKASRYLDGAMFLEYERTRLGDVPERTRHQVYAWPPGRARVEVKGLENAPDSLSILTPKRGWISSGDERTEVDPKQLGESLSRQGLTWILRPMLELGAHLVTQPTEARLVHVAEEELGGRRLMRLTASGGTIEDVWVDPGDLLPRRIKLRGGEVSEVFEYDDFRLAFVGVLLPYRIQYWRGGILKEDLRIRRLEVHLRPWQELMQGEGG